MKKIEPLSFESFIDLIKLKRRDRDTDYHAFYADRISKIKELAPVPFSWFIWNNYQVKAQWVSDNIHTMTPFTENEWLSASTEFFRELYHPDDRFYIFSAFQFAYTMFINRSKEERSRIHFNFYGRMQNSEGKYRWTLLQTMDPYVNEFNEVEASLLVIYDLSGFGIEKMPLFSFIDFTSKDTQYVKYFDHEVKTVKVNTPRITEREKMILRLMVKGMNTPQIASMLFISYHTVENHKRNLRQKTNSKTSAELVAFVITHNLLY